MEASIAVCIHDMQPGSGLAPAIKASGNTVTYSSPSELREAGFPHSEANFTVDAVYDNPNASKVAQKSLSTAATDFVKKRQNLVVFGFGVRSSPKRQLMFGSKADEGFAAKIISDVVSADKGIFTLSCYVLGQAEHLVDLINAENELGTIVESVKEGPRVRMVERAKVASSTDVKNIFKKITQNYTTVFADVLPEKQPTAELEAMPPYNGDTIMLQLFRYEDEQAMSNYEETNSMSFISLGDSERPVLCGVDAGQIAMYEKTHRVLLSAAGIVSSIKCSRLRVPFGKSKMSQLLRRCYNAEKGYERSLKNGPTSTHLLIHCFSDGKWAEETFHSLSMAKRITNTLGSSSIGSMLRDLAVEKWRLDQDVTELRDEVVIAKTVYEYKPCICESTKQIPNIREEEQKRLDAIEAKREEAREKQQEQIRKKAKDEAQKLIKEQEANSGTTLAELERTLAQKKKENEKLQAERDDRTREYEQILERTRQKKETEESAAEQLKEEMAQVEEELATRREAIQVKQKQLEMAKLDKQKGRDAILKERDVVQAARRNVMDERRRQREQWIKQIKDINTKVMDQIKAMEEERKQSGEQVSAKEEAAEKAVVEDIKTIEEYLPKLISLEDTPVNPDETESIRRQFDDVFAQEKQSYLQKIEEEKARKEKLEKGLEAYRNRVLESAQAKKKENMQEAVKKQNHLSNLMDQVLTYLRSGVKMTKISSKGHVRRRFYFISDDGKRIHSCELDNQGAPINRRKPPVTIWMKDIKKVVLGVYTSSFVAFSSEEKLTKTRMEAVTDNGTFRHDPTQSITPGNLGSYNYRAFGILLRGGKSLEVVCDSDTDCEAWAVGLKRLLDVKADVEKEIERRLDPGRGSEAANSDQATMKYGAALDVRTMRGFVSLSAEEAVLCSEWHVPPALFLRVKQEMSEKAQTGAVTTYDVRVCSGLDLVRSCYVYDFLVKKRIVPLPV